jgi:hypothetical protein
MVKDEKGDLVTDSHNILARWRKYFSGLFNVHVVSNVSQSGFGGLVVSMLASGKQDRVFKPGRSRRIFSGVKNPKHAFLRKGSKAVGPVS